MEQCRTAGEINNNNNTNDSASKKNRKGSIVSVSSASSYLSDSSEECAKFERKASLQEIIQKVEDKTLVKHFKREVLEMVLLEHLHLKLHQQVPKIKACLLHLLRQQELISIIAQTQAQYKRERSMSDGAASKLKDYDSSFEVFPSLPNSVLEKMGLRGGGPRERLSEEELEQKFTSLALAFTIDATTVKDRCERQKRYRDQTEMNLSKEIERLREKLALMQPLCTDCEKAELLASIMSKIDVLMKATSLVAMAAERFGSVQHEERLTESTSLMVTHVQMLKQQRDAAKRQLEYTKQVYQNESDSPATSPTTSNKKSSPVNPNAKGMGKRRASIATITQQIIENKPTGDFKKITRRISDVSLRALLNKTTRPNRLELVEIKEGYMETSTDYEQTSETDNENSVQEVKSNLSSPIQPAVDLTKLSLKEKIHYQCRRLGENFNEKYTKWIDDGTMHEVFCFCALICFSFSLIIMANILIEYEYAKRGISTSHILWSWRSENGRKLAESS